MAQGEVRLSLEFDYRGQRFKSASKGLEAFAKNHGLDSPKIGTIALKEIRVFLDAVTEALAQRHSGAWPGGTSPAGQVPGTLSSRSGGLVRRLRNDTVRITGDLDSEIRGRLRLSSIMGVHEFGATIRPKKAQFLTIPLPAALNDDGTPKLPKARDWPDTFVARSRKGNLIIFQKIRGSQEIVPLYVLKKEVVIPPRLGAGITIDAAVPAFVDSLIEKLFKEMQPG